MADIDVRAVKTLYRVQLACCAGVLIPALFVATGSYPVDVFAPAILGLLAIAGVLGLVKMWRVGVRRVQWFSYGALNGDAKQVEASLTTPGPRPSPPRATKGAFFLSMAIMLGAVLAAAGYSWYAQTTVEQFLGWFMFGSGVGTSFIVRADQPWFEWAASGPDSVEVPRAAPSDA